MLEPSANHITHIENILLLIQMQGLGEATEHPRMDTLGSVLATIYPDIKRTLVRYTQAHGPERQPGYRRGPLHRAA